MSDYEKIEELLFDAVDTGKTGNFQEILSLLEKTSAPVPQNIKDCMVMLIDNWQLMPDESREKTIFLVELCQFFKNDFPELRLSLPSIVKKVIPNGFNRSTSIKGLGIRNENVMLCDVYSRFLKLTSLTEDKIFFNTSSSSWGKTDGIDWIAGTIKLSSISNVEYHEVNLEIALDQVIFFDYQKDLVELIEKKTKVPKQKAKQLLIDNSATAITDMEIRNCMFFIYIPEKMTPSEFETWWKNESSSESSEISIEKARSIHELNQILGKPKTKIEITDEILKKINIILSLIRPSSKIKDFVLWADTLCMVLKLVKKGQEKQLIPDKSISEKVWPDMLDDDGPGLGIWTNLKASSLGLWAEFTKQVKGEKYLIDISTYLPWKVWPAITAKIKKDELIKLIESSKRVTSPEALLWIWKNKTTLPKVILEKVNTINLFASLARKKTGAIWNSAVNDLKKLIIESKDFQVSLIKDNKDEAHIIDFIERLNNLTSFSKTEKQSIIVKLSRHFPAMKDLFNSGKAKKVLTVQQEDEEDGSAVIDERHITSVKSYNEKLAELDDIINVQMPQNTRDIATARAHGDLRENAEYAAAKERQKYLTEHRAMLEDRILTTIPTDFTDIELKDKIIAGCTVNLKYEDGKTETYHILGAWDSDPSKHYVSYETGMGKAIIGKKAGDEAILPDGRKTTIEKIAPLSEKIRSELTQQE